MADRVTTFLMLLADRLAAGPLDAVTQMHSYPLPMQIADGALDVVWSASHHASFLAEQREAMAERGVRRIVAEIGGIEVSQDQRGRAWVRWLHLGTGDRLVAEVPSVLFLRRFPDGEMRVEMLHFITPPLRADAPSLARPSRQLLPDAH